MPHPTSSTASPRRDAGFAGERVGQALCRGLGGFLCVPQSVVNVPAPEQPVEHRRQVVVTADFLFGNGGAGDHGVPVFFKDESKSTIVNEILPRSNVDESLRNVGHRDGRLNNEVCPGERGA